MKTHPMRLAAPTLLLALAFSAGCGDPGLGGESSGGSGGSTSTGPVAIGNVTTVAADPNVSGTLALNGGTLYWVDRGAGITDSIQTLSLPGGYPQQLYVASPDATAAIEDLAVDAQNVYVTLVSAVGDTYTSSVEAIPESGLPHVVLATAKGPLFDLSVAGSTVYFTDYTSLFGVPALGGPAFTVVKGDTDNPLLDDIVGLASHAGLVYWTQVTPPSGNADASGLGQLLGGDGGVSGALMQLTSSTTKPTEVASVPGAANALFAANDTTLFWITSFAEAGADASTESYVVYAPIAGGMPHAVTSVTGTVAGLAADDTNVYVLTSTGLATQETLFEVAIAGGTVTTLASGIQPPLEGDPRHALVVYDGTVYFADTQGIESVPR